MKENKLIYNLGFVAVLATLGACGGGSGSTGTPAPTGNASNGQSAGDSSSQSGTDTNTQQSEKDQLLTAINNARATGRNCGSQFMPAVSPVTWNDLLEATAQGHSEYLRDTETFSHSGAGGSSAGDRATTEGYNWQTIGENLAAGYPTVAGVMQGWIDSAGHCENLMVADFTEVGVSKVQGSSSNTYSDYWTMVLAKAL